MSYKHGTPIYLQAVNKSKATQMNANSSARKNVFPDARFLNTSIGEMYINFISSALIV